MRILLTIIITFLVSLIAICSDNTVVECNADFFAVDNLDQIYYVKGAKLIKLNQDGSFNCEFSNNLAGNITSIDVTDPLRILVYYKEMNQILFLDNKLVQITSPVLLDDLEIYSSGGVCGSPQNRFWIYDNQKFQLLQFSESRELIQQSTPIDQVIGKLSEIGNVFEKGEFVYLHLKETGVIVFDSFGSYYKTFPGDSLSSFQVTDNLYFYLKGGQVMYYDFNNMSENKFETEISLALKQIFINKNKLYLLSTKGIHINNLK